MKGMNNMVKLVKERKSNFTMVNNNLMDLGLHAKSLGIYAYLWSRPDDWDYYETEITKHFADKRDAVRSALAELEEFGLLERVRRRDEGRFSGYNWIIYEEPQPKDTIVGKSNIGKSNIGKSDIGKSNVGKSNTTNTNTTKTQGTKTEGTNLSRKQVTKSERDKKPTKLELAKKLWTKQMNPKLVDYAADLAKRNAKYELSYFNKIMQDWQDKGYETIEDTKQAGQSSYGNPKHNKDLRPTWMKKGLDKQVVEPVSEEERAKVIAHIEAIRSKGKTKGDDVS